MYLVLDPAGPTAHLFVTMDQAMRAGQPGSAPAAIVANQPRVQPDDSPTGFQLFFPEEQMFQCHIDADIRAKLMAHCQYSEADELARLQAEFPRRVGTPGEPDRYWLGKEQGNGGYATVYAAYDSVRGERIACKIAKASYDPSQKREIVLQAALNHSSIVGLRDVVYAPPPAGGTGATGTIYIMMEFMGGGELFKLVRREKGLAEAKCSAFFRQIMLGVAYCHSRGVCHRDLKLENVLLNSAGTAVKIADFGFAKDISNSPAQTVLGTARYVAPEQLDAQPYDGSKADMWACGVILYIMREGQYPFRLAGTGGVGEPGMRFATQETLRLKELLQAAAAQLSFKPENRSSDAFRELVAHMLDPNPATRWSAAQVLQHPWTRGAGVSEAEIGLVLQGMDTDAIVNPQGERPDEWLGKLRDMPETGLAETAGAAARGAHDDDMMMDDDDEDEDRFD
eukprot:COSAG02_NODE_3031_length_7513_cov_19.127192_2_plen_453_part_00